MSVNSKMTALADEIRELSGTSEAIGLDAMKAHVNEANTDVAIEADLIEQIVDALEGKAAGGEQATPEISVNFNGLVTATAGTKSSTYQLAFQPAKTITPSTTSQIAVSSGYYTGGDIMVAGDSNLVASNIKSGISIFGVNGTLSESDNEPVEWSANEDAIVRGTISVYTNNITTSIGSRVFEKHNYLTSVNFTAATSIGNSAFADCHTLLNASFPAAITIGASAFNSCWSLANINFPVAKTIGAKAFNDCYKLTTANFPACEYINEWAFYSCRSLTTANFPACSRISSYAFYYCNSLTTANFPACEYISSDAFYCCRSLTSVDFTACEYIGDGAFMKCSSLTTANFPACTNIDNYAFDECANLTMISLPACINIGSYVFGNCYNLSQIYLTSPIFCTLSNSTTFTQTPYAGYRASFSGTPYIYVPESLLTTYQTATNWAYFSKYFSAIEDVDTSGNNTNIITFTISDVEYQAEEGMTWAEWIESEYNTGNYFINSYDYISKDNNETIWVRDSSYEGAGYQQSSVQIIENTSYNLSSAPI